MDNNKVLRDIGLVFLTVFLFWLILTFNLNFLVWICFAPFFFVVQYYSYKNVWRDFFWVIFLSVLMGSLLVLTSFTWFGTYSITFLMMAVFLITLGFVVLSVISLFLFIKIPLLNFFWFPLVWLVLMIVFSFNQFGNSWMNLAFFQTMTAPLVYLIGSYGVTFLIFLSNSLVANYFKNKDKRIFLFLVVLFLVVFSCFVFSCFYEMNGDRLRVVLVQGNFNESWEWRFDNVDILWERYERLTLEVLKEKPDLVVWPEYAIVADVLNNDTIYSRVSNLADLADVYLVLGSFSFIDFEHNLYYDERKDTAIIFSPEGELVGRYDSVKPQPMDKEIIAGNESPTFELDNFSFTLVLCFEEYFGVDFLKDDSDFIISMVNNQRFDNTRGIELVSLFSRLRAVENNKYVLRVSNTGKTQVVSPRGKVLSELALGREGFLVYDIYI